MDSAREFMGAGLGLVSAGKGFLGPGWGLYGTGKDFWGVVRVYNFMVMLGGYVRCMKNLCR